MLNRLYYYYSYVFFFFQAEDGIRDIGVTGVQTCALPIFVGPALGRPHHSQGADPGPLRPASFEQLRYLLEPELVEPPGLAAVVVPAVGEHEQVGQVLAGQLAQQGVGLPLAGPAVLVEADLPVGPSRDLACHGGLLSD